MMEDSNLLHSNLKNDMSTCPLKYYIRLTEDTAQKYVSRDADITIDFPIIQDTERISTADEAKRSAVASHVII